VQLPAHVVEVVCVATQKKVIAKLLRKKSKELSILQELSPIQSVLNHVIPLVDTIPSPHGHVIILPEATPLSSWLLFLSYPPGTLRPRTEAEQICHELIEGVAFLHQHGIAHLDIKPDNLVLRRGDNRLYIIDFDISVRCKDDKEMVELSCGTPGWAAPEIVLDDKKPTSRINPIRADLWSCGAVLERICRRLDIRDGDIPRLSSSLMDTVADRRPLLHTIMNEDPELHGHAQKRMAEGGARETRDGADGWAKKVRQLEPH
jgi:serine/threonine protein kinase